MALALRAGAGLFDSAVWKMYLYSFLNKTRLLFSILLAKKIPMNLHISTFLLLVICNYKSL